MGRRRVRGEKKRIGGEGEERKGRESRERKKKEKKIPRSSLIFVDDFVRVESSDPLERVHGDQHVTDVGLRERKG